jgi:uncharacterized protein (TIGR02145 family)
MKILLTLLINAFCIGTIIAQDATLIYKNTVNSTVTIETDIMLGSGFFVSPNIIVTNFHVIEGASEVYCYSNNSATKYKIEGYLAFDKSVDLILLKVSGLNRTAVKRATSPISPGQKIYVIGSPKGLPASISDGLISGLRDFEGIKLIQITAPISHGSSGGPVLNANGELIGVSVGQYEDGQNLNFAIPKSYLESLLKLQTSDPLPITTISGTLKSFTDSRDEQNYKAVKIGNQIWMSENLKTTKFTDGSAISLISNDLEWNKLTSSGFCWYDTYKGTYGALYNWYAVNTGKLCPVGWHIPTDNEWTTLINYLGGEENAAGMLMESGTDHWNGVNSFGTNETGFTALPGGNRSDTGKFGGNGDMACWWSSSENETDKAWIRYIYYSLYHIGRNDVSKQTGLSVRCVKD